MPEANQSAETVIANRLALKWCPTYETYYQALDPAIVRLRAEVGQAALDAPIDPDKAAVFKNKLKGVLKTEPTQHVVCGVREDGYRWIIDTGALDDAIAFIKEATSSIQA